MEMLRKIIDSESLEISLENIYDGVPFKKVKSLPCSDCNLTVNSTQDFFLNMYRQLAALKRVF